MDLFVYGTLLDGDLRTAVLGRDLPEERRIPATAPGMRRVAVAGHPYPMLLPHPTGAATGLILRALDDRDFERLSAYEGPDYILAPIALRDETGRPLTLPAYLGRPGLPPGPRAWTLAAWQRRDKPATLRRLAFHRPRPASP